VKKERTTDITTTIKNDRNKYVSTDRKNGRTKQTQNEINCEKKKSRKKERH